MTSNLPAIYFDDLVLTELQLKRQVLYYEEQVALAQLAVDEVLNHFHAEPSKEMDRYLGLFNIASEVIKPKPAEPPKYSKTDRKTVRDLRRRIARLTHPDRTAQKRYSPELRQVLTNMCVESQLKATTLERLQTIYATVMQILTTNSLDDYLTEAEQSCPETTIALYRKSFLDLHELYERIVTSLIYSAVTPFRKGDLEEARRIYFEYLTNETLDLFSRYKQAKSQ